MSRIAKCFDALKAQQRPALIPYLTAGDPDPSWTVALMHQLVSAGADIIELGVPFSDPMADGPTIQQACERALKAGTYLGQVIELVAQFRADDQVTPVVLMGYLNPVEAMGVDTFIHRSVAAGIDGVLTVDLAVEEQDSLAPQLIAAGIDPIFLLSPTTSDARVQAMDEAGRGYLYYVSLKGVTGSSSLDPAAVAQRLSQLRQLTQLPIAVGFGIRSPDDAAAVAQCADGVVVGSALVELVGANSTDQSAALAAVRDKLAGMASAIQNRGKT